MADQTVTGLEGLDRLCEAMGINHLPVRKIVVEMDVNDTVKVYVAGFGEKPVIDALVKAVQIIPCADVTVSDRGEVSPR